MNINTDTIVSMTEANQNFSRVARLVDEKGVAVIMKNNTPRYVVLEFNLLEEEQLTSNEDVLDLSKRYIDKNRQAYLELAK
ncbi:MAG: type II toxin-antitoxin system Phd/YefM family antitoxin [Clostridiaceae bacterium]|nr:type II toxin-antitoxin system Phd/YefM family antitoxin [Clostridiaceae bacterium]